MVVVGTSHINNVQSTMRNTSSKRTNRNTLADAPPSGSAAPPCGAKPGAAVRVSPCALDQKMQAEYDRSGNYACANAAGIRHPLRAVGSASMLFLRMAATSPAGEASSAASPAALLSTCLHHPPLRRYLRRYCRRRCLSASVATCFSLRY